MGAGSSGVVNKVVHLPTGRTLALKVRLMRSLQAPMLVFSSMS